jgi:preprotein translocase subunit YajC
MLELLISTAHAQEGGASPAGGGGLQLLLFFGSIIAIWWFLVIRPQTKQATKHRTMVAALKRGDEVVTTSGMFGKVAAVEENAILLDVGKGVKIRFVKDKVSGLLDPNAATVKAADEDPKKK